MGVGGLILLAFSVAWCQAFSPTQWLPSTKRMPSRLGVMGEDYVNQMSDEEKLELFQVMLRDLQVEGVPLLDCDADQVHTLQTALWTTMAELCEQDEAQKVCLVLSQIPMDALKMFVDDFFILKTQRPPMDHLPDLERVSASLVGKGLGPAIVLEVAPNSTPGSSAPSAVNEYACSAAMKAFVDRVMIGNDAEASFGMGSEGMGSGEIQYRFCNSACAPSVVAYFWNCVCELLTTPDEALPNMVLQLPALSDDHERFVAITQLISRSLCLFQGDAVLSLVHLHPKYSRDDVYPVANPAFGHLPPLSWIEPMLRASGKDETLTSEELQLSNYQHRAPSAAVNILRNSLLGDPQIVDLNLDDGRTMQASGLDTYTTNALKAAAIGPERLQEALEAEIAIMNT